MVRKGFTSTKETILASEIFGEDISFTRSCSWYCEPTDCKKRVHNEVWV